MAKAFSPMTMFRQVSPIQLQAFFRTFGVEVLFELKAKRPVPRRVRDMKPFEAAYNDLTDPVRATMDEQIVRISKLATVAGIEILSGLVKQYRYEHWLIVFHKGDTHYHKVLDVWLNRREMFDQAFVELTDAAVSKEEN